MRSEKSKKGSKNNKAKRNVQTVGKAPGRQSKEEIISEEELENRIAISGDIRLYLTMHLRIFIDGYFHHPKKKKLINLAQYIYDQKVLYIHKHGGSTNHSPKEKFTNGCRWFSTSLLAC